MQDRLSTADVPSWIIKKLDALQANFQNVDRDVLELKGRMNQQQDNHTAVMNALMDIRASQHEMNRRLLEVQSDRDKAAGVVSLLRWLGFGGVLAIIASLIYTQSNVQTVQPGRPPEEKIERVLPGG